MKITVILVGKLKEKYLKMGIEEYKKRLSKYCKLELIEVQDEKSPENMSLVEEEQAGFIETLGVQGQSHIVFVIGGSIGLLDGVLNRVDYKLSFSKMTSPIS